MPQIKVPTALARLIDAAKQNSENPITFEIPSFDERNNLKIGDFAKIALESPTIVAERFWVEISARLENRDYVGRIDNDIDDAWGIHYNDHIQFEPRHILSVLDAREYPPS